MKLKITEDTTSKIITITDTNTDAVIMTFTRELVEDLKHFHDIDFYKELKITFLSMIEKYYSQEDIAAAIDTWLEQNNDNTN